MKPARRFLSGSKRVVNPVRSPHRRCGSRLRRLTSNVVKFLVGALLLPVCLATSIVLYSQLGSIQHLSRNQVFFLLGVGAYIVIHLLFYQPTTIYVFGHELTHALCTWVSGGRVRSFHASWKGGKVTTTKSNAFISLAPYFFPIYTAFLSCGYFAISLFSDLSKYTPHFIFLIGLSWSFHIVLTVHFIKMRQPDILKAGTLFSIALIYILNVTILALILSLLFPEVTFGDFFRSSYWQTAKIYTSIFTKLSL